MGSDFTATTKFRVNLVNSDGESERVSVQVGLDGLKICDASSGRTMRSYELGHISRWQSRGNSLLLYTRTPVDVEERQLTLQGDEHTIRSALDTLTCSCMQLAELLQSKPSDKDQETSNSLHALVAGGGKKKTKLPSADDVEYWKSPDKAGWLQSQGEVMKSWRKRWFVLKQGYLFRFMNSTVTEATKPRGVVDLSKIQDVKPASSITNRPNSLQLKTASGGSVCYICDSETELVEWMSALDGALAKIVKHLAGVDDEPALAPALNHSRTSKSSSSGSRAQEGGSGPGAEWLKQLERNFEHLAPPSGRAGGSRDSDRDSRRQDRPTSRHQDAAGSRDYYPSSSRNGSMSAGSAMVDVVGYDTIGGGAGASGGRGAPELASQGASGGYAAAARVAAGADAGYAGYGREGYGSAGRGAGEAYGGPARGGGQGGYGGMGGGPAAAGYGPVPGSGVPAGSSLGALSADTLVNYGEQGRVGGQEANSGGYARAGSGYGYSPAAAGAASNYGQLPGYGGAAQQAPAVAAAGYAGYGQQPSYAAYGQSQPPQAAYAQASSSSSYGAAAGGYSQYANTPGPASSAPSTSLIDQVPHMQPAYPYFQQGPPAQQQAPAAPAQQPPAWQVHHTAEGRPYYYNPSTGCTQWETPPGM